MLTKIVNYLKTIPAETIAVLVCVLILFWAYGCEPKVESLDGRPKMVTRVELEQEVENFLALAQIRFDALSQQEELQQIVFNNALIYAEGGAINPIGVLTTLGAIFGLGATGDNIRQRKKLKTILKEKSESA